LSRRKRARNGAREAREFFGKTIFAGMRAIFPLKK
jgi:hypothetical protein